MYSCASYFQYAARDIILARLQKYCEREREREGGREEGREGGRDVREEECVACNVRIHIDNQPSRAHTQRRVIVVVEYVCLSVCLSVSLSLCLTLCLSVHA